MQLSKWQSGRNSSTAARCRQSQRLTGTAIHLLVLATLWLLPLLATAATSVELRKTYSGKINYIATGKSFRDQDNTGGGASCSFFDPLARSASINLPPGAVIEDAFLYFGA